MHRICGTAALSLIIIFVSTPVLAHGGGLNAEGCHNDRKNGGYHCHRGAPQTSRPAYGSGGSPAKAVRSNSGGAFANCTAARAAGAAPVRRGDRGYGPHLDRDGDGVGCE
ncbi:excalibur calcium-binding domain-containing protein [Phenylobacterium sp.]|uniref:excalibur calcium-binding domain-containing protein n=1 Tax=Phenylobacterium sp. TaxID=1871053 RepID=UPI0038F7EB7F